MEYGTDESLAKLTCFEPAGHGKLLHVVPCIAVKPQVTSLHQLLFRSSSQPVWWNHGLLPNPHTCSDCSVPSAVLLSAGSPEFLSITEAQSLPRSKISCNLPALVLPQLRELQYFLEDKKKSALPWGKCLIFALTEQCNKLVLILFTLPLQYYVCKKRMNEV